MLRSPCLCVRLSSYGYLQVAAAGFLVDELRVIGALDVASVFPALAVSSASQQSPRPTASASGRYGRRRFRRKQLSSAHAHRGQSTSQHDEDARVQNERDEERNEERRGRRIDHVT